MDASEWIRIDIGYQDRNSFNLLMKYAAKYSSHSPACIALVGDLKSNAMLANNPDIQAILTNTLPCSVLNRNSSNLDYIPPSCVSIYNRLGTETFYIRITGRHSDILQNTERREFLPELDPADEIELDLAEMDSEYSRLLLFVFALSHTILWFHMDSLFSNYDLRLMKVVDLARLRGLTLVTKTLSDVTENKDWIREGCLCCPRLIFIFSGLPLSLSVSCSRKEQEIEKVNFEQDASVRLYTLLKKCRLVSIPRSSGLCFVSAKKGLVLSVPDKGHRTDAQENSVSKLLWDSTSKKTIAEIFDSWPSTSDESSSTASFSSVLQACLDDILHSSTITAAAKPAGFPWPSHFCRPSISEWLAAALQLHNLLFQSEEYRGLLDGKLGCTMSISRKYSRSVAAFSINSSALQTSESAIPQIQSCLHSYMQFARGPAAKDFGTSLTSYLADGALYRRQCPVQSIFGSRCTRTVHYTPGQPGKLERDGKRQRLPIGFHQSRSMITNFCSCGKSAEQRTEPFNIREANEIFYETMDFKCCCLLNSRIDFPSATINRKEKKTKDDKRVEVVTLKRYDSFPELAMAMQLNDREISQPYVDVIIPQNESGSSAKKEIRRPYMFQLGMSLTDVIPRFSSWVIYGLGSSDIYRAAHGLEHHIQADFLNAHHHLIPIDAEIVLTRCHKLMKRLPNRPTQTQIVEPRPWHSRIYFGLDYECPKGHRFIYRSKEIFDLRTNGEEESAQNITEEILHHGAALFVRCPCKNPKESRQFIAQLMRIHLITPKEPMKVGIMPKVKVSRGVPIFTPGLNDPLVLEGGTYWVMRFPFCYYDSERRKGPFCAPRMPYPKHRKLPCSGSLLGGFLKFFESLDDNV